MIFTVFGQCVAGGFIVLALALLKGDLRAYCEEPDHSTLRMSYVSATEESLKEAVKRLKTALNELSWRFFLQPGG